MKNKKTENHKVEETVHTPEPPQVMDPSRASVGKKDEDNKGGYNFERKKYVDREKLAPREEL